MTNAEIKKLIKDAESKVGTQHALVMSKAGMILALKELLWWRSEGHKTMSLREWLKKGE